MRGGFLADDVSREHYERLAHWAASGDVLGESWRCIAQPHLAALIPFRSMLGVYGRRSFDQVEMISLVAIDHPIEHTSVLARTFNLRDRPIVAEWMVKQAPLLVDLAQAKAASELEASEANRYGLGRVAIHGHLDAFGNVGTYFSFAGVSAALSRERACGLLALIVPHLHLALCRRVRSDLSREAALTDHERELWRWLAAGRRSSEIAAIAGCTEKTIRNRLTALYRKLDVSSRAEAIRAFLSHPQ